jgi:hypothetical protein
VPYRGSSKSAENIGAWLEFHGFFSILILDLSLVEESWGGEGSTFLP